MTINSLLRVQAKRYGGQTSFVSLKEMESCMKVEDITVLEVIQIIVCATSQPISSHLCHDNGRKLGTEDSRSRNSKFLRLHSRHQKLCGSR